MVFTPMAVVLALLLSAQPVLAGDEVALFDGQGEATAYVVVEDMTIYLWSGKPVAYLDAWFGSIATP
jgi:hypothetical protein